MARLILTNLDLNKNELQNVRVQNIASAPSSPVTGQIYYDTTNATPYFHNGTSWIPFDASKVADAYIPIAKLATNPLARANHTGTQLASTISDFNTAVRTNTLNQMDTPTADVAMGGFKITGVADPVSATDAVNLQTAQSLVQSAAAGIDSKPSVRLLANANISLSGTQTIDGVTAAVGDRVLVRGQTTGTQNGVYVVSSGAWGRAADADQNYELTPGAFWFVEEGTSYAKTQWRIENTGSITIGTTSITINQFGAASVYTNGNGIALTGNVFSIRLDTSSGLVLSASGLKIDTTSVVRKVASTIGDGSSVSYVVTHNLGNQDCIASVRAVASPYSEVITDISYTSNNTLTIAFASAPTSNQYKVVIFG